MVRAMVCQFGMSDKLGMVMYGGENEYVFLGRDMAQSKDYSEDTAQMIDSEMMRITRESYERAEKLITDNRDKLDLIAECLLEYETLDGKQVEEIVRTGKFTPPDSTGKGGDGPSGEEASTPLSDDKLQKKSADEDSGLGSSPAPAPA
jgi:cell division protease FtsH